ncbi:hypothetical protein [Paracraurococcus lichenis]|uniref:Uncharacterized protein n=1 Tax=Paracraurococcus lichenis TaxID=3064888 RepID=A0ABT9E192_9PROT|nr:hypothetical protein [Paracraurococcus sp. LOR1-02]MDO9709928.1 hypothetical protein [Paracraurococcus sp. LOR1-02]
MATVIASAAPFSDAERSTVEAPYSETTRYLAAAAHSDSVFRQAVLEQIHAAEFRCKAPEFGIDESVVIKQCQIADRRRKIVNLLLLSVLILFLLSGDFVPDLAFALDQPDYLGDAFEYNAPGLLLALLACAAIVFGENLVSEHFTLRRRFARMRSQSPLDDRRPSSPRQNIVVYGGYSPFVGSGLELRDWSFSVNLHRKKDDCTRAGGSGAVSVDGLIGQIRARMSMLAIPGLEHYPVLFADGRHIRQDRQLMSSPYSLPPRSVPEELLDDRDDPQEICRRTYLCISVTDWNGEMVLTTYLRFKKGEAHLFAEASHFVLPPLKHGHYAVDSLDPSLRIKRVLQLALVSTLVAPFRLLAAPFQVYAMLAVPLQRWSGRRQTRRTIRENPLFNYGAVTSIRQLAMENRFRVFFQKLDRDMHLKTIEQCLIDSIVDYLDERDIDTSDIKERRSTILNQGVVISGGVVTAESIAAGHGATSVVSKVKAAAGAKGAG